MTDKIDKVGIVLTHFIMGEMDVYKTKAELSTLLCAELAGLKGFGMATDMGISSGQRAIRKAMGVE